MLDTDRTPLFIETVQSALSGGLTDVGPLTPERLGELRVLRGATEINQARMIPQTGTVVEPERTPVEGDPDIFIELPPGRTVEDVADDPDALIGSVVTVRKPPRRRPAPTPKES